MENFNAIVVNNKLGERVWFAWGGESSAHQPLEYLVALLSDGSRKIYVVNDTRGFRLTEEDMEEVGRSRAHRFCLDLTEITESRIGQKLLEKSPTSINCRSMEYFNL